MMKRLFLLLSFGASLLYPQFAEVTIQLDKARLKQTEQAELQGLDESVRQFYQGTTWAEDIQDLDMWLDIHIAFQSTIIINNVTHYQAQVLFNNRLDQMFLVKNALFPYSPGRAIRMMEEFEPLAATLTFYAYLLFAGELDTYEILAGSIYYNKAKALALVGQNALSVSKGWGERIRLVERLEANQDLRRGKFYFYQAYDLAGEEKPDMEAIREAIGQFYASIKAVVNREGQDRYVSLFLTGHAEDIAELMALAAMWDELADMAQLNPDADRFYKNYLRNRNGGPR